MTTRLRQAFRLESEERLISISNKLFELEKAKGESRDPLLEVIFRDAHSLKGAARAVSFNSIENFFQMVEDVFGAMKNDPDLYSKRIADLLQQGITVIEKHVAEPDNPDMAVKLDELGEDICLALDEILSQPPSGSVVNKENDVSPDEEIPDDEIATKPEPVVEDVCEVTPPEPKKPIAPKGIKTEPKTARSGKANRPMPAQGGGSVRINRGKMDKLIYNAEEMVSLKQLFASGNKAKVDLLDEIHGLRSANFQLTGILNSLNRDIRFLVETAGLSNAPVEDIDLAIDILHMTNKRFNQFESRVSDIIRKEELSMHEVDKLIDDSLENVRDIALQPFAALADTYPRMMRDLAQETGHPVNFEVSGGNLEIDRRILDQLNYPIIHLLRNAVDHGIESAEEREQAGKSACGNVSLEAVAVEGKKVQIIVKDDGRGIDLNSIREKIALTDNISAEDAAELTDKQILEYIFLSGFSTTSIITSISGRGLGMSIVRETVENLGGTIKIENNPGMGSEFILDLPVSLSSMKGVFVEAGKVMFAVPLIFVRYASRVCQTDIENINGKPTWSYRGKSIPVAELTSLMDIPSGISLEEQLRSILVIKVGDVEAAIIVDRVIEEVEITVKPMGKLLRKVPNISGAAVIGADELVPVINVRDLMQSIVGGRGSVTMVSKNKENTSLSILVAEDSITTRMLLTSILESAGYEVETAIDGQDALYKLRAGKYDMLVSDVEMPRMNGFELTEKVRSDDKLSDLPVILCTTLSRREDRERGVQVGANAYLTKKNFEQSNLLETVDRLI